MNDPVPENIDGKKVVTQSHEIHHSVNWGYVAIAVAALAALYLVWQKTGDEQGDRFTDD